MSAPAGSRIELDDGFLRLLDENPAVAEQKLEALRAKLARFAIQWGCTEPEDVASEAILRVWANFSAGKAVLSEGSFRAYCYRVARNVAFESTRRRPMESLDDIQIASIIVDPNDVICAGQCLTRIPPEQQTLLREWFQGNKEELEANLGIERSALAQRVCRLLKKIRNEMSDLSPNKNLKNKKTETTAK